MTWCPKSAPNCTDLHLYFQKNFLGVTPQTPKTGKPLPDSSPQRPPTVPLFHSFCGRWSADHRCWSMTMLETSQRYYVTYSVHYTDSFHHGNELAPCTSINLPVWSFKTSVDYCVQYLVLQKHLGWVKLHHTGLAIG